jgi:hypothetical protein
MSIYAYKSYKNALNSKLHEKKKLFGRQFTYQNMADHCRIQKTYLSKVLSREGNLTEDQLYLACTYLSFNEEEIKFCLLLLSIEKCCIPARKSFLESQLKVFRENHLRTEESLSNEYSILANGQLIEYHTNPTLILIHIFLTIDEFSRDIQKISKSLNISIVELKTHIEKLISLGLIIEKDGRFVVIEKNLHLSKDSPVFPSYRSLMRLKALEQTERFSKSENYSFSAIISTDDDVRQKIQSEVLKLLKKAEGWVSKGKELEFLQFNIDLLKWS